MRKLRQRRRGHVPESIRIYGIAGGHESISGDDAASSAADAGDTEAYNGVATCLIEGVGTLPDPDMAIHYLKLAEASGDTSATLRIKDVQNMIVRSQSQKNK